MKQLKKQINESFFNSILYFIPLLVFIVGSNFWSLNTTWKVSFPVGVILLFYIYFNFNRLFVWYLVLAGSYTSIGLIYSLLSYYHYDSPFYYYADDVFVILLLLGLLVYRTTVYKLAKKTLTTTMPMTNNMDELFRLTKRLLVIIATFTIIFLFFAAKYKTISDSHILTLNYVYLIVVILFSAFEIARVVFIRNRLLKENWVPIVSKQGVVIGKELCLSKVFDEKKYMHPIVRMYAVSGGKVLLQQTTSSRHTDKVIWDAPVDTYVHVGETIQEALNRDSLEKYGYNPENVVLLSNYSHECESELEYVYLFVGCIFKDNSKATKENTTLKWWTPRQILDNIDGGIFSEEFLQEYKILERSGLIYSIQCVCDCEIKDAVNHTKNPHKHF